MAEVSDFVRVIARLATVGATLREFGRTLFLYRQIDIATALSSITKAQLDSRGIEVNRANVYANLSAVDSAFDDADDPYMAAAVYFQQSPFPRNLVTSAWYEAGAAAYVWGGPIATSPTGLETIDLSFAGQTLAVSPTLTQINEVGGYTASDTALTVDDGTAVMVGDVLVFGTEKATVTAVVSDVVTVTRGAGAAPIADNADVDIDFASRLSLLADRMAAAIQALPNFSSSVEVVLQTAGAVNRIVVKVPISDVAFFLSGFVGIDAATLGLDSAAATMYDGVPAETIRASLDRVYGLDDSGYWLTLAPAIEDDQTDVLAAASWANSNQVQLIVSSNDPDTLTANETSSTLAMLRALEYDRVTGIYSASQDYKAVSLAGRLSSVNFQGAASHLTAKFKALPGTAPDPLTRVQEEELLRKRVNFYTTVRAANIIASDGTTFGPGKRYIDGQYFIDWMIDAIQVEVFNLLTSGNKIPNTVDGIASIKNVIAGVCEQGVENGGIAPGTASEGLAAEIRNVTGNRNFDGELNNGYLIYAGNPASLTLTQRTERDTVPFNVWVKLAGAIHNLEISLAFEN